MVENEYPEEVLDDFTSRIKMEEMIPKGALKLKAA